MCRLGWSQKQGDLQAPVGYDKWSYAYRDIDGSRVHESVREDGWAEGYGESQKNTATHPLLCTIEVVSPIRPAYIPAFLRFVALVVMCLFFL
jgi:hypothetical protein